MSQEIKRFNISRPHQYEQGGEKKTRWDRVGTLTEIYKDDGNTSRIIEIPAIGLEARAFPFEDKKEDSDKF